MLERIQVFQFGTGAELPVAERADRDIGIAAEAAFLQVAVADSEIADDGAQLPQIGAGLLAGIEGPVR